MSPHPLSHTPQQLETLGVHHRIPPPFLPYQQVQWTQSPKSTYPSTLLHHFCTQRWSLFTTTTSIPWSILYTLAMVIFKKINWSTTFFSFSLKSSKWHPSAFMLKISISYHGQQRPYRTYISNLASFHSPHSHALHSASAPLSSVPHTGQACSCSELLHDPLQSWLLSSRNSQFKCEPLRNIFHDHTNYTGFTPDPLPTLLSCFISS